MEFRVAAAPKDMKVATTSRNIPAIERVIHGVVTGAMAVAPTREVVRCIPAWRIAVPAIRTRHYSYRSRISLRRRLKHDPRRNGALRRVGEVDASQRPEQSKLDRVHGASPRYGCMPLRAHTADTEFDPS